MTALFWAVGAAVLVSALVTAWLRYRALKQPRVITCPETGHSEAVEVDARHHVAQSLRGDGGDRLSDCTRWPERADCGQACLQQIEAAPDGCRARGLLEEYYTGKICSACGREIGGDAKSWVHEPGLVDANGHIVAWNDVAPRDLPAVLSTHQPLCWDCKMVESVYEKHPDKIVERPARW